jgi:hypothetical protein
MANIIQQQDLLKGLPDDRLSMLMQNPTGDIPPFLVAAEAQRRQSIREQFSGGPQESVVDTLTKQLASVPQNIEAPMQTPPQMPPPQMQAGVGALEQGMRDGGMVQRYQDGSLVERYYRYGPRGAGAPIARVGDASLMSGIYNFLFPGQDQVSPGARILSGDTVEEISSQAKDIASRERTQREIDDSMLPMAESVRDIQAQQRYAQMLDRDLYKPSIPPDPNAGKNNTSIENQTAPAKEDLRARLEEIMKAEDPSNWDKAQKWFAMAAQFAKPSKNMMENIASGAAVFAEGAAEEERSRRLADLELKKALYQYDVAAAEDERDTAAAGLKARTDIATGQMNDIRRQQDNIIEDIQSIRSDVTRYGRDPQEAEATIKVLKERFDALGQKLGAYESYISEQYGFSSIPSVDTANEKINYPTR